MRSPIQKVILAAVVIATAIGTLQRASAEELCVLAPIPDPASIPESYTAVLSQQRPRLENQKKTLIGQVNKFNTTCAKVVSGSKLDVQCAGEEGDLKKQIADYQSACEAYNQKTVEAVYLDWVDKRQAEGQEKIRNLEAAERRAATARDNAAANRARKARAREEAFLAAERRLLDPRLHLRPGTVIVSRVIGSVCLQTTNGCVPMPSARQMRPGEAIKTGPNSWVDLVLGDGSRVRLEQNGVLEVGRPEQPGQFDYNLSGKIHRALIRQIKYKPPVKIPPSSSIRGTEYTVEALPDTGTIVTVLEGIVDVTASDGVTAVAAGQRLRIGTDGKSGPLEIIDLKRVVRWWEDWP